MTASTSQSFVASRGRQLLPLLLVWQLFYLDVFIDYTIFGVLILFMMNGAASELALLAISFGLPTVLFGRYFGRLADRVGARYWQLLVAALLGAGMATLFLLLSSPHHVSIYAVAFCKAALRTLMTVVILRSPVQLAEPHQYSQVHGLISLTGNIGKVAGPILSYVVLERYGSHALLALSAAINLFAAGAVIAAKVIGSSPSPVPGIGRAEERRARVSYRELLRSIRSDAVLLTAVTSYLVATFSLYVSDDMISLLIKAYHGTASGLPVLIATIGAGGILGASLPSFAQRARATTLLIAALYVDAFSFGAYGFCSSIPGLSPLHVVYAAAFVMGIGTGFNAVGFRTVVSERVPTMIHGQFFGTTQSLIALAAIICPLLGAYVANTRGLHAPFQCTAAGILAAAIYCARTTSRRAIHLRGAGTSQTQITHTE